MGLKIPALLDAILEATAAEASAKARVTSLRATLETEARRRWTEEGAAPTWNTPKSGKVRFDPPGDPAPYVADPAAFGAWVAEQYPTEVRVFVELDGKDAAAARQALEFAGIDPVGVVEQIRPAWSGPFLTGLEVEEDERTDDPDHEEPPTYTAVDPASGEVVPGLSATKGTGKLVVTLDPDRKRRALEDARTAAEFTIEEAESSDGPGSPPAEEVGPIGGPDPTVCQTPDTCEREHPGHFDHGVPNDVLEEALSEVQRFARSAPSVIAIMDAGSREVLRRYARAKAIPVDGTKGDLAIRLSAAGHTPEDVIAHEQFAAIANDDTQEPTP